MTKIIKLSKQLSNQISAWEVVERPVSVVKELVENSLDAGATKIKVEIENWGIDKIIISDNWSWIEKEDLEICTEKYTTSKIKSLQDLYNVMTFWFRWEALASISSVSKLKIISKTGENNFWNCLEIIPDEEKKQITEVASETGTKIIVENLFYNTPARLNYLKKPRTEYNHILEFLNSMALSYPEISFEFISEGKEIFNFSKWENLKTRIYHIFWEDFSENLLEINFWTEGLKVTWFISDPKISFPNRNRQILFVNKRLIKSPLIYKAISNAYNRFIPHNTFSWYILNLEINPTEIDVNVHPRKQEIKFATQSAIFRIFFHSVEEKLNWVSLISTENSFEKNIENSQNFNFNENKQEQEKKYYTWSWTKFKNYSPYKDTSFNPNQGQINNSMSFSREILKTPPLTPPPTGEGNYNVFEKSDDLHDTALGKIIGQTFNSYIVVETKTWLKILDQHALAERVIYEKLVKNFASVNIQGLLIAESFSLTPKEFEIVENYKEIFFEMWFEIELMWNNIVLINAVPDLVKKENLRKIFLWVIEDIWELWIKKSKTLEEVRNKILAYTACRSAVKFWDKLNLFEMNKLLNDASLDYSATCPHWRPVIFEIWLDDLKNKYER